MTPTPPPVARIREDTSHEEMRRLMRGRTPFRNTRGTFRAARITPADLYRLWNHPDIRAILSEDSCLAFLLDEPDYVVFSGKAPLVWHSTTRGIKHRKDESSWTWVQPKLRIWPDRQTEKRYNRMVGIVNDLNERPT